MKEHTDCLVWMKEEYHILPKEEICQFNSIRLDVRILFQTPFTRQLPGSASSRYRRLPVLRSIINQIDVVFLFFSFLFLLFCLVNFCQNFHCFSCRFCRGCQFSLILAWMLAAVWLLVKSLARFSTSCCQKKILSDLSYLIWPLPNPLHHHPLISFIRLKFILQQSSFASFGPFSKKKNSYIRAALDSTTKKWVLKT